MSEETRGPDAGTIGRLAAQRQHYKQQSRQVIKERDEARKQLADLAKQVEDLKKGDSSGRVKELETELRTVRHRRAFDRLAKERGASDDVLDDLFEVLKYKADSDEPDEAAIAKLLDAASEHPARSRFFAEWDGDDDDDQGGGDRQPEPVRQPSPDAGRGSRHDGKGTVYITRDQLSDPAFMLNPANQELLKNAKVRR